MFSGISIHKAHSIEGTVVKFVYQSYLFLLPGIILLYVIMMYWYARTHRILSHIYSQDYLVRAKLYKVTIVKIICSSVLYLAIVFGLAGPEVVRVHESEEDVRTNTVRIMVIDVSKSMYVMENGVKRIDLVLEYLHSVVNHYPKSSYVVYVFTDRLSKLVPATEDIQFVHNVLSTLKNTPVINGSTDFAKVVDQLQRGELEEMHNTYSHVYLYFASDGESHTATPRTLFTPITNMKITPVVLSGGVAQGVPIPVQDGYVIDKNGEIVMSYANPALLKSLADAVQAEYVNLSEYNEVSYDFGDDSVRDTVQIAWIGWLLASIAMYMYALTLL